MARLISRQKQIPNGFVFYQPQTGWKAPRFASFDQIKAALIRHRKANRFLAQKYGWNLTEESVAIELDEYNATHCIRMGWLDYVSSPQPAGGQAEAVPFQQFSQSGSLGKLAAGGRTLIKWIASGEEAVPQELANARAAVCAVCPLNEPGTMADFFTEKISQAIAFALKQRKDWNLSTPLDDKLNVCTACWCPLPLKMHVPIDFIMRELPEDVKPDLAADCWMRSEGKF